MPECGADGVFDDEIPTNDPGEDFAQSGVTVGVCRTGNRNQGGEFGVTQASKDAARARQNERQYDGWASEGCGYRSGQNKNSGADNCADAKRDQVDWTEHATQALTAFVVSLGH